MQVKGLTDHITLLKTYIFRIIKILVPIRGIMQYPIKVIIKSFRKQANVIIIKGITIMRCTSKRHNESSHLS